MAKFFRGGTVFPFGRFGREPLAPLAPPVGQDAVVPLPNAMPVGPTVPVLEPRARLMIQPELMGAVPQKPILPPLFDRHTAASFYDRSSFSVPVDTVPMTPRGATALAPPPPVIPPFTTKVSVAVDKALRRDNRALIAAKISLDTQARADAAAHAAGKAETKARLDPTPAARGDADAKRQSSEIADELARRAAEEAARRQAEADAAAARAHELIDQGDPRGYWAPQVSDPGTGPAEIPGYAAPSKVPTVVAAGGGAAVGFVVAGPLGALVGALLGGVGYNYVKNH